MAVAELGTAQHVGKGCCWGPGARGMLRHRCGTAAAPRPQPAPLGSAGGEHLSSGVVLFSVSLALKAIDRKSVV